jgi:hypothetical protein
MGYFMTLSVAGLYNVHSGSDKLERTWKEAAMA